MSHIVNCVWKENLSFLAEYEGYPVNIDASEEAGGNNQGVLPKPMLLMSLAGCTGIDVISILKKMRITPDEFNINVQGELSETLPKVYTTIHIVYEFKGKNLPKDNVIKAVKLSQEKYCGVSAMLRKSCELTWEIRINDIKIETD